MTPAALPEGQLTFFMSDIEGSTRLVQKLGDDWLDVLETHNRCVEGAIKANHGVAVNTEGDSFFAVFQDPVDALKAAVAVQRDLGGHEWPLGVHLKVRIGLHTGTGFRGGADYVGLDVHRAARISDAGHGGQILLSEASAIEIENVLPDDVRLRDLGKFRLKDLTEPETLFQVLTEGLELEFPELRTLDAIPNNLPLQVTSFVGRQKLLETGFELLARNRVLTLTGPGGTGKTRLALQIAADLAGQYPDGAFFVGLAPITDPELIPSVILSALGLQASTKDLSPREKLLDAMSERNVLMVLDNFEHVIPGAPLVSEMVRASPRSRFVVTSRSPLRVSGEQEMPVPPLSTFPDSKRFSLDQVRSIEAVALFAERARHVRPEFKVTAENAHAVVELVSRLDGLPLAIELVATRVRLLPVEAIVEHLDARMLSAGSVDVAERQRTIYDAIAWSFELVSPEAQNLFCRMSVFVGSSRLSEIAAVCGSETELGISLFDGLAQLGDQSLIRTENVGADPHFGMLHVIREFAGDRLVDRGEDAKFKSRHARTYADLVEQAAPHLVTRDRGKWLDRLEKDHENLRTAFDFALETGDASVALRIVGHSWRFLQARGHLHEAKTRADRALAMEGGGDAHRAKALEALGGILWWKAEMDECLQVYTQALALQRRLGNPREIANALYNHALALAFGPGLLDDSDDELDEAEHIYMELGDIGGLGDVSWGRGTVAYKAGLHAEGIKSFENSLGLYERSGNEFGLGWGHFEVGNMSRQIGDLRSSWEHLCAGLKVFAAHRDVSAAVLFLAGFAGIAQALGDDRRAVTLAGAFHGFRVSSGAEIVENDINQIEGLDFATLESLSGELGKAYGIGAAMGFDRAIDYALEGPAEGVTPGDLR